MTPAEFVVVERVVVLALVAAVVGSFLNVCIHRVPLGKSVVRPRSACPACGAPIRARHNVPVLSWLWLRGRCADCGAPISIRYPAVELANVALWIWVWHRFGWTASTFVLLPFVSAMLVLFFTDLDHQLLPNRVTLPLALVGLALSPWNPRLDPLPGLVLPQVPGARVGAAVVGAGLGYGIFLALWIVWKLVFKRDAIGGGDFKLMLGVGAFLGWPGVLLTIFGGSIVGALLSLPFLVGGRWSTKRELPFGCFLAPAAVLAALYGPEAIVAYVRWLV